MDEFYCLPSPSDSINYYVIFTQHAWPSHGGDGDNVYPNIHLPSFPFQIIHVSSVIVPFDSHRIHFTFPPAMSAALQLFSDDRA